MTHIVKYYEPEAWTITDSEAAWVEGWDMFDVDFSGPHLEIEFICDPSDTPGCPDPNPFASDDEVIAHCERRAAEGSELHRKALQIEKSWNHRVLGLYAS